MSILTVKNMNHGFGDRAIFEDVSFRLLKGEHVGFGQIMLELDIWTNMQL